MGKSRKEIQKAYRERQKAKGPAFLEKEKARQRQYYKPADQLSDRKRCERNLKNKMRNRLSRLRKKERNEIDNGPEIESTSGYESYQDASQQGPSHLVVRLPVPTNRNKAKGVQRQKHKALSSAYRKIKILKTDKEKLQRQIKIRNRKIHRLQNKFNRQHTSRNLTPRKQTDTEVTELNLTPKRQKNVRRKLMMLNTLTAEIRDAKNYMSSKKRRTIANVVSGRIAKKYRCINYINKTTGLSRNLLAKVMNKDNVTITKLEVRSSLSKEVKDSVHEFFHRDDNSRAQPGKADVKKVGPNEKMQTRVLTDYMKNLHEKYLSENPDTKVSLSTFQRLRPKHILLTSFISRNTCQCIHHQNMALKVQGIRKAGIKVGPNPEHLIPQLESIHDVLESLPEKVSYRVWRKVEIEPGKFKMKVLDQEEEAETFKSDFEEQLQIFQEHVSRVQEQYTQVRRLKENLPESEMVLQMDFAENFSCRSLDEVQTAYWNQSMVTLHPIVAYFKQGGETKHQSYVVVSDEMSHSASTVCAFLDKIVPLLKLAKPDLTKIHYWTDFPSSQYRNRYMFHLIANHKRIHDVEAIWNFFEVGHGKGPCDGLGGTVKRMADESIRQGHYSIQDANEFFKWAVKSTMKSVRFVYVSKAETMEKHRCFQMIKAKPLKGTMKLHAVGMTPDKHRLMTRETSCYCEHCRTGQYCNSWTDQPFIYTVEKDVMDTNTDEGISNNNKPHEERGSQDRDTATVSPGNPSVKGYTIYPKISSFVAAVYDQNWYVGQVTDIDEDEGDVEVNFMMRAKNLFKWPQNPDRIWIEKEYILCEIPPPLPSGKSKRLFKIEDKDKIEGLFTKLQGDNE